MPILITDTTESVIIFQPTRITRDETDHQDQFVYRMNTPIGIDIISLKVIMNKIS
jgi:hypothetical protein